MKVNLSDIVEALEMISDSSEAFLNKRTGEIVWLSEYMDRAEYEELSDQLDEDGFYRLPTQYDIHEYKIMTDYIDSLPSGEFQKRLSIAVRGRGAFRRFKDELSWYGISSEWYSFRDRALEKLAETWCQDNGLQY